MILGDWPFNTSVHSCQSLRNLTAFLLFQSTFTDLLVQEVNLPPAIGLKAIVIQRGTFYVVSVKTLQL